MFNFGTSGITENPASLIQAQWSREPDVYHFAPHLVAFAGCTGHDPFTATDTDMVFACMTTMNDARELQLCDGNGVRIEADRLRFIDGYWQGHVTELRRKVNTYIDEMRSDGVLPTFGGCYRRGADKPQFRGIATSAMRQPKVELGTSDNSGPDTEVNFGSINRRCLVLPGLCHRSDDKPRKVVRVQLPGSFHTSVHTVAITARR